MSQAQHSRQFINERKMAVALPLFVVPFLAIIFFIFGGGTPEAGAQLQASGINTQVPKAAESPIVSDKLDAYKIKEQKQEQAERMRTLDDYAAAPGPDTVRKGGGLVYTPAPQAEVRRDPEYDDLSGKVQAFYQQPAASSSISEAKLDRLLELMERQQAGEGMDVGRELAGHPYLQYLERTMGSGAVAGEKPAEPESVPKKPRREVVEVAGYKERVAQKLPRQGARSAGHRQGNAFYTLGSTAGKEKSNTVSAVIHQDQTLVDGSTVKLRLLGDVNLQGTIVPRNSFVYGIAAVRNERLVISIENVRYGREILPVDLQVYDTDGMPGVYIPGSIDREAGKEALSDASGGGGYNVTMSTGVKEQLTMQAAQTGLSGIKSLASRKARAVKVHVKANYRVYLKSE